MTFTFTLFTERKKERKMSASSVMKKAKTELNCEKNLLPKEMFILYMKV